MVGEQLMSQAVTNHWAVTPAGECTMTQSVMSYIVYKLRDVSYDEVNTISHMFDINLVK